MDEPLSQEEDRPESSHLESRRRESAKTPAMGKEAKEAVAVQIEAAAKEKGMVE